MQIFKICCIKYIFIADFTFLFVYLMYNTDTNYLEVQYGNRNNYRAEFSE